MLHSRVDNFSLDWLKITVKISCLICTKLPTLFAMTIQNDIPERFIVKIDNFGKMLKSFNLK